MDRLDDFRAVHSGEDTASQMEAIGIIMESVGITEPAEMDLMQFLHDKNGHGQEAGFILGLIIGIMAHEHKTERES